MYFRSWDIYARQDDDIAARRIKLSQASIYQKYVYDRITVLRNLEVKIAHEDDDDATTGTLSYQSYVFMKRSRN